MRVFRRVAVFAVTGALALMVAPAPAQAHNELRASNPAKGAKLASAPAEVTLDFAERLDPRFTTVAVTDAAGKAVVDGKPQVDGVRAVQRLRPALDAGAYTVAYRVVSVDGHPVRGSHTFTVTAPPTTAPATPAAPPSPTAAPTSDVPPTTPAAVTDEELLAGDGDDRSTLPFLLLGGVVVLALGTGLLMVRRRGTGGP
ncbi:copper resistance protein CopC [Micromonospora sp. NPDC050397]|uniref:copper resistance CopC family protein n=1 Tax=Micromonospora sp. NPDC050397 TaxID=3364279 RepID=UPI00384DE1E8